MHHNFYAQLTPLTRLADVADAHRYKPLPLDWHLVLTEVGNAVQAIREGRYREVSLVGAASIAALLNLADTTEIPFLYRGNGAILAIPAWMAEPAQLALGALQTLARQVFDLELRAGVIPVVDLAAAGQPVRVARLAHTDRSPQAAFSGGLAYAERLIEDPRRGVTYRVPPTDEIDAVDLHGLECRWQDLRSPYGEIVSLLAAPAPHMSAEQAAMTLRDLITLIEGIYGRGGGGRLLEVESLRIRFDPRILCSEVRMRAPRGYLGRLVYLSRVWTSHLLERIYQIGRTSRSDERHMQVVHAPLDGTYDNALRIILAGAPHQRDQLEASLRSQFERGNLAYGLHVSDRAMLIRLVLDRKGWQVYWIDGADGGYTLANRDLKARLAALAVQGGLGKKSTETACGHSS